MFVSAGARLTMRIRRMTFEAMLRQVLRSHQLVTLQVIYAVWVSDMHNMFSA